MPRVTRLRKETRDGVVVVAAEHDGYRRLESPAIHRRTFAWLPNGGLVIVDRLLSNAPHAAASFLHLAPGLEWNGRTAGPLEIRALGAAGRPACERGRYAPFIGSELLATALARRWRATPGELSGWSLLRTGFDASLRGDRLSLSGPGMGEVELPVA
jgi:hypothetical protein